MIIINNQKGVALIIVLTVVMLLTAIVFSVNYSVRKSLYTSSFLKKRAVLLNIALSGTDLGIEILLKDARESDPKSVDSVHDDWANYDILNGLVKDLTFSEGDLKIFISDELGKININSLIKKHPGSEINNDQRKIWENILDFAISADKSVDDYNAQSIIECIADWIDKNDSTRINGAEKDFYLDKEEQYLPPNSPLRSVDEIYLIKGISDNLFNIGNFISELTQNDELKDKNQYIIEDYLTVYGYTDTAEKTGFSGKININTAKLPVIISLIPKDKSRSERYYYAKSIMDYRDEKNDTGENRNNLNGNWYLKCPGCLGSGIYEDLITTKSNFFLIEAISELQGQKLTVKSAVERYLDQKSGKWKSKILSRRVY